MKEGPKQKKALNYYYSLGDDRTYAKVAEKFNVRIETICRWVKLFDWKQKIEKRDGNIQDLVAKLFDLEVAEVKSTLATMFMKDLVAAQTKEIETHFDKRETVKLLMGLMGEATEISKVQVEYIDRVVNFVILTFAKYVPDDVMQKVHSELKSGMPIGLPE